MNLTAIEILDRLVGFDTTSVKPNRPLIDWVQAYLASHGVESVPIATEDGLKANLFATIGPKGVAGIGLSGHTDVVPVAAQAWDTDPFRLTERDGRLYGRGTTDMKGFVACALAMVPDLVRRRLALPFHILLSYDEEIGCTGVLPMIEELGRSLPRPRVVFVGEPTSMTVVDAHKGGSRFRTDVVGKPAHSSVPRLGVGAIRVAGELIAELGRMEARLIARHPAPRFDPPHPTVTVSMIEGGTAHNVLPPTCAFQWGVRTVPGLDVMSCVAELQAYAERELLPAMHRVSPECSITTVTLGLLPAFDSGGASEATSLALKIAGQNETFAVPYGTEASHFQASGSSSVVCGPGDIAQAHQPNEFIAVSEIDACMAFLRRLADWAETASA